MQDMGSNYLCAGFLLADNSAMEMVLQSVCCNIHEIVDVCAMHTQPPNFHPYLRKLVFNLSTLRCAGLKSLGQIIAYLKANSASKSASSEQAADAKTSLLSQSLQFLFPYIKCLSS